MNTIIWDWNGTLLDDTKICIDAMNILLLKRNLPLLSTRRYKAIFNFPVKSYYQKLGFNFESEPFELPANEFIEEYNKKVVNSKLQTGSIKALKYFKNKNCKQYVLSAMEQNQLHSLVSYFKIDKYFEQIAGIDDHYASGKIERGKELFMKNNIEPECAVLIGDTIHDKDVAEALNCKCLLIANGHNSYTSLVKTGVPVYKDLNEVINKGIEQILKIK
jgi:phosphoglycolate phosphatase